MKKIIVTLICILCLMLSAIFVQAQDKVGMADEMRSNGRIYVVIAVILTILLGLILYVARIDRKISKLEKNSRPS